ncbi:MAG: glycosyltransferase family A protein [Cyanobacteria bacterium J06592_8]
MNEKSKQKLSQTLPIPEKIIRFFWDLGRSGLRELLYQKWSLERYISSPLDLETDKKVTIIVPSYHASRARNLEPLIRMALKCNFVEKIIISNHNPDIKLEDWVKTNDSRVKLINHSVRRGCGYGWIVASQEKNADYFIVIDDDMLIYPQQLAVLFQQLINQPEIPHGFIGRRADGEYVMSQELEVEFLYNIYAVTQTHIQNYLEYTKEIIDNGYASQESIEYWADDIVVSKSGIGHPRIHQAGSIRQCKTTKTSGVATFTENQFDGHRLQVYQALIKMKSETTTPHLA